MARSASGLKTDPKRSALMRRVRQRDTEPELAVRRILTSLGARYRVNVRDLPGSPDVANKSRRRALFVHGCFWHSHQFCSRGQVPKRNREFWSEKLGANRARDTRKVRELSEYGFDVLVVWECELEDEPILRDRLEKFWTPWTPES
jgi:DNA mismatch endonuclease (patch repair protein)